MWLKLKLGLNNFVQVEIYIALDKILLSFLDKYVARYIILFEFL